MADEFTVRVQSETGCVLLKDLTSTSMISDLRAKISSILKLPSASFHILSGYPPRPLSAGDLSLDAAGIKSGEVLRIQRNQSYTPPSADSAVPLPKLPVFDAGGLGDIHRDQLQNLEQIGAMMRVDVPSNNSCLFTSVHYLLTGGRDINSEEANNLRCLIAQSVARDPLRYNEGFLGMPNEDYCNWIQNPDHWGGAIELSILSDHYGIEIVAVDVMSLVMHRFGENRNYANRMFLIYDGIHYEPLVLETGKEDQIKQTLFPVSDQYALLSAREVAQEAQASRQFVDIANFSLRCLDCNTCLKGEKEAREHAAATRHAHFGEIKK